MVMGKQNLLEEVEALAIAKAQEEEASSFQIVEKFHELLREKKSLGNPFPIEAFPPKLGAIAQTFTRCYGLPVDYFGLGMLTAASVAIGNGYAVSLKQNHSFPPILYSAVVGNSSIGKTPAIMLCLGPIFHLEETYREQHHAKLEAWKQECFELKMGGLNREDPPKPTQTELVINDATTEAINASLEVNPRGLLMFRDELNGWINSLNQYRKGSDLEFWLSVWSNQSVKVNRIGRDSLYIRKPFVSVIGGIQPAILNGFATDGRSDNGFLARILFAWPDEMKKPYESNISPDPTVFEEYRRIIANLHKLPHNFDEEGHGEPILITLTEKARKAYSHWYKDNTDLINAEESDTVKSILGKMESYLLRLALILSLADLAITGEEQTAEAMQEHQIGEEEILRAVALVSYFKKTALRVIGNLENPVKKLSDEKEAFYEALPEEFSTKMALEAGQEANISERTVKRLLNDFLLFKQLGRGRYRKHYL